MLITWPVAWTPGVGAAGGGEAHGLAAEGGDRRLDRALHRRLVGLGLEAV